MNPRYRVDRYLDGSLTADEAEEIWNEFAGYPIFLEEPEPLMPAAVEVVRVCGCTV